jgi:cation diffusion facilitator CzcD-associated flavoprotein CzcO
MKERFAAKAAETRFDVAIVGAGFSGLCMGMKLQQAGLGSFVILEKADEVGGTWRENTYPGCACDVQSHLYSYSFEGNPSWSHKFAPWHEILDYMLRVTEKHGLRSHIRFGHKVDRAVFDEKEGLWRIHSEHGATITARAFILGTGPLHVPLIPQIPGLETFRGKTFHSAQWAHDYDLRGKRVASIGTGASAIQYLPEIAPEVAQLYVFQRSAPWVLPKPDRAYTELERLLFRLSPRLRKLHRGWLYVRNEARVLPIMNPPLARMLERGAKLYLRNTIEDPALVEKLTPDYTIGCKRVLLSNNYYQVFNRSNVELVTDTLTEIRESSVVSSDGVERPVDAIIFGTGFHADPRDYLGALTIQGLGGQSLLTRWANGAEAHLGISVTGFPNMFELVGPNAGLGHNSLLYMIESQVRYIIECLKLLEEKNAKYMDVRPEVLARFNQELERRLEDTVWASGCKSWYTQEDGKNIALWPGFSFRYRARTRHVNPEHYLWTPREEQHTVAEDAMSETEIQTEIDIAAPPSVVWSVLSDFSRFGEWNPMVTSAEGLATEGSTARLRYRSSIGLPLRFEVRIMRAEPDRELRWVGSRLGISGEHYFRLTPRGQGTRLLHGEVFRGPLAGAFGFLFRDQVPVFESFNRALKRVAEHRFGAASASPTDGRGPSPP